MRDIVIVAQSQAVENCQRVNENAGNLASSNSALWTREVKVYGCVDNFVAKAICNREYLDVKCEAL